MVALSTLKQFCNVCAGIFAIVSYQRCAFQVDTVDKTGLLLTIVVLPANIQDRSSALAYVS